MPTRNGDTQFTVVVPTINSAPWIADLHHYYRFIGVDPFYCIDSKTQDHTAAILARLGARYTFLTGEYSGVEPMIASFSSLVDTPWILRIDDDECPAKKVLDWIRSTRCEFTENIVAFPRKWLRFSSMTTLIFSASAEWDAEYTQNGEDRQFRLYRKDAVTYRGDIHTPGFVVTSAAQAPVDACLYHFDWILRSKDQRLAKIARYHGKQVDNSWMNKFYIFEDVAHWDYSGEIVDDEILQLAHRMRQNSLQHSA